MSFWNRKKKEEESSQNPKQTPKPRYKPPGLEKVEHIIAVASGKGGVGKSTVAANLAVALQKTGAKVGLMDADIYGPSQPGMLGASNSPEPTVVNGKIQPTQKHGISFMSMGLLMGDDTPAIWRAPMAIKMIQQFISQVAWGELDYLLVDLPPGTGDIQLTLAQHAALSGAIIVTTPQHVALGIAKKGLRMFERVNVPVLGIIENMSGFTCEHCGGKTAIFKEGGGATAAKQLEVPYLGPLPLDPDIMQSGDDGIPILTNTLESNAAKAFLHLADNLQKELADLTGKADADMPTDIQMTEQGKLSIEWHDGQKDTHTPYDLRIICACALCVDENTGKQLLQPKQVPLDIKIQSYAPVGRYAITIQFSDGHNTGIYTFKKLREHGKEEAPESFEV